MVSSVMQMISSKESQLRKSGLASWLAGGLAWSHHRQRIGCAVQSPARVEEMGTRLRADRESMLNHRIDPGLALVERNRDGLARVPVQMELQFLEVVQCILPAGLGKASTQLNLEQSRPFLINAHR